MKRCIKGSSLDKTDFTKEIFAILPNSNTQNDCFEFDLKCTSTFMSWWFGVFLAFKISKNRTYFNFFLHNNYWNFTKKRQDSSRTQRISEQGFQLNNEIMKLSTKS